MAILKVARLGHPILRRIAQPVTQQEIKSADFQRFIDDMIETMREYDGVGLAAPQVHRSQRVAVIELTETDKKGKQESKLHVFINPKLEALTTETSEFWEGCLSVPNMRGLVRRPKKVKAEWLNREGQKQEKIVEGFLATVLQHEFDHLDGKVYVDRLVDSTKFAFEKEFERYWLPYLKDDQVLD